MKELHVYTIDDRPGLSLVIGVPEGDKRPAIWLARDGRHVILARFYSDNHARACADYLDTQVNAINRVITFLQEHRPK